MSAAASPTPTALAPGPLWVNEHNYGPLVSIITWFLIITSFLSVSARVGTRLAVVKRVYADDITIMVALLLSVGQSICVSLEVTHGLGKPIASLDSSTIVLFMKENFSSEMLYLAILTLIKISVCFYLTGLTPIRTQKMIVLITGSFILLWGVSSMFVLGFACQLPQTWNIVQGKCINLKAFWTYIDVMNIVTDLPLIILPAFIISKLQADAGRKAIVIACFACRVLVIGGAAAQIFYLQHDFATNDGDVTSHIWRSVLCSEVVVFLSFFTACIPYLKPLIEAMESGMIRGDDLRRRGVDPETYGGGRSNNGKSSRGGSRWGRMLTGGGSKNGSKMVSTKKAMRMDNFSSNSSRSLSMPGALSPHSGKHNTNTTISAGLPRTHSNHHIGHKSMHKTDIHGADDDGDSQSSQSKIIKKTMTFNITEEPQARMPDYLNGGYAK